jgi:hypothetical protein
MRDAQCSKRALAPQRLMRIVEPLGKRVVVTGAMLAQAQVEER